MCYGNLHNLKNESCNCSDPLTEHHFQKERFNLVVKQKNESIASMEAELKHLREVIINLKRNASRNLKPSLP
jgi:hypothetical protein